MKKIILILLAVSFHTINVQAQLPKATNAKERIEGLQKRKLLNEKSLFKKLSFDNIGPTIMSGRVVDVDVNPANPIEFYVAYASGGLWYTNNNGQSFTPKFDYEDAITIGDIAVDWKNKTIWIGTGENNSSRSSYAGVGIYKSKNDGKSWEYMGLEESHHIGKIILSPTDKNTAWVGVVGHLYSPNNERGIYKTNDGGNTWKQVLFIDNQTGCIDIQPDPINEKIMYASMWHRERYPWNFVESGSSSGIYKTIDGGNTWELISGKNSGIVMNDGIGRIGLAVYPQNPNIIYAIVDNQNYQKEKEKKKDGDLTTRQLRKMSAADFLKLDSSVIKKYLKKYEFPEKYSFSTIMQGIKTGKYQPNDLANYVSDANNDLFDTPIKGAEIYKSNDAGKTWNKMNRDFLDGLYNTYGYYFGRIFVSPTNADDVYVLGVPILKSEDGAKTFKSIDGDNQHGDHHMLWINPTNPKHLINGNDGGLNISFDDGKHWIKCNTPAVGQFYSVAVDEAKPYNVYGGLQDNGVWVASSQHQENTNWHDEGQYPYKRILGGDGMQIQVDTRDNNTVYTGYQFGHYFKVNKATSQEQSYIHPHEDLGEAPLRFNWQTPIWLSKHQQDIFYMGSNRFHRSLQQGENLQNLSNDLTQGKKEGDVPYGTITTIAESSLKLGLMYLGTDDGLVWMSNDIGYNWKNISAGLPKNLRVMRVTPSNFVEGRIYVALSGFQFDHFNPYLFVSNDYGNTWKQIGTDLPHEPVNVMKEDLKNKNLLYVGTDNGLYCSLNEGKSFMSMMGNLPRVAVHDIALQNQADEIIVGTHGRSIYKTSLNEVRMLCDTILSNKILSATQHRFNKNWGKKFSAWGEPWEQSQTIHYFSNENTVIQFELLNSKNNVVRKISDTAIVGLNTITFNFQLDSVFIQPILNKKGKSETNSTYIKAENNQYYCPADKYKWVMKIDNKQVNEYKWELKSNLKEE